MFGLILSILAIILAIGLAGVAILYRSDAFTSGKAKADATKIINQATQIEAAMTLYNSQNNGQLDVGGTTSDSGLFDYLLVDDYLKNSPDGNGGVWTLKCVDGTTLGTDPSVCGSEGVALTLSGVSTEQCNLINVLLKYEYETDESSGASGATTNHAGFRATEDGYIPTCTDEPNAPCCNG